MVSPSARKRLMFVDQFLDWAHDQLLASDEAQAYFRGRGVSEDQWAKHRLGFIGGDFDVDPRTDPGHDENVCHDYDKKHIWCDSCRYRGWSSAWEEQEDGGRKIQRVGRRIAGSIVFPLTSYSGQAVGFQIRSLVRKEYDTFAIRRRPEGYFFGIGPNMSQIWASREVCLVEGPADQLIVERLVRSDVLALTTAGAGAAQLRFLRRFVKRIYLCLDLDKAGRNGTRTFIEQNGDHFDIVSVKYNLSGRTFKDTNDLWRLVGDTAFSRHMKSRLLQ